MAPKGLLAPVCVRREKIEINKSYVNEVVQNIKRVSEDRRAYFVV